METRFLDLKLKAVQDYVCMDCGMLMATQDGISLNHMCFFFYLFVNLIDNNFMNIICFNIVDFMFF